MRKRPAHIAAVLGGVAILLAGGTIWIGQILEESGPECTVPRHAASAATLAGDGESAAARDTAQTTPLALDAVQLQHASTINAVGLARGVPERARVIAIAAAFQESSLRNLVGGDRDSVGLFQQRPSQGWGDVAELQDPVFASGAFYDALLRVRGWESMPLAQAAQKVQRSGFPDAYAKWEPDAYTLAAELGGAATPALSCRAGAAPSTRPAPVRGPVAGAAGLEPQMATILGAAQAELGGIAATDASAADSVTVTISLPNLAPATAANALAAWAVAHAASFGIDTVGVGASTWTGHAWRPAAPPLPDGTVQIAMH